MRWLGCLTELRLLRNREKKKASLRDRGSHLSYCETGDRNRRYCETGDRNRRYFETGDRNWRYFETGDRNEGYCETGERNLTLTWSE